MLTLIATLLMWSQDKVEAAVRKADAELAKLEPYPIDSPKSNLGSLFEKYQEIVDENDSAPTAEAGVGKCLSLFGRYREAADAFKLAGPKFAARLVEATLYADVAAAINKQMAKLAVRQLRHVPNSNLWVAILSSPNIKNGWVDDASVTSKVVEFKRDESSKHMSQIGKGQELEE